MDKREAQARMDEIQRIMERSTLYTALPGMEAILGGSLALAGSLASMKVLGSASFGEVYKLGERAQWAFWAMWAGIAAVSVVVSVFLAMRELRRQGLPALPRPGRLVAFALTPSVLVACVVTIRILWNHPHAIEYLAPLWMMCYGTGVYGAGLFSLRMPRMLGMAFMVTGAAGLLFLPGWGVLLTGLSFGGYHIVFGMLVLRKRTRMERA